MRSFRSVWPFLAVLLPARGASIDVSTSCDPLQVSANNPGSSSCSGSASANPQGEAFANAQASGSFSPVDNGFEFSLSASANAFVAGGSSAVEPNGNPNATANASITDWLETPGPMRLGVVRISGGFMAGGGGNGAGVIRSSFGGYCLDFDCSPPPKSLVIELGEVFRFTATDAADATFTADSGNADGVASGSATYHFFEADGVTPVAVSETPEPPSLALVAVGLVWILGRNRSRHGSARKQLVG